MCFYTVVSGNVSGRGRRCFRGEIPERSKGADCKSAAVVLRRFESSSPHHLGCVGWRSVGGDRARPGDDGARQYGTRGTGRGDGGCGEAPVARWFFTPADRRQRGSSSGVEHQPSKLRVAGSNPVSRSIASFPGPRGSVVEHFLGKEGVTGSIPVVGSTFRTIEGAGAPRRPAGAGAMRIGEAARQAPRPSEG